MQGGSRYNSWHDVLTSNGQLDVDFSRLTANEVEADRLVLNELTMRLDWARRMTDPRRDVDRECGYPDSIGVRDYWKMFRRDPLGNRACRIAPEESWRQGVRIYEDEDPAVLTPFERDLRVVGRRLDPDCDSWLEGDKPDLLLESCFRADVLSQITTYGVMVIGIDDGKTLDQPAKMISRPDGWGEEEPTETETDESGEPVPPPPGESTKTRELLYICPLAEAQAPVDSYETDERSPRFRRPLFYNVTFEDPLDGRVATSTAGPTTTTRRVHWTRVVHIAPDRMTSEVNAIPCMEPIFNTLMEGRKVYAGLGEAYWLSAFAGMFFGGPAGVRLNAEKVKAAYEQYRGGLQRSLIGDQGATATPLNPAATDPTPYVDKIIEAICIQKDIPVRIFKGSERGELASSQDEQDWLASIKGRQNSYLTPRLLAPLISRLISLGVLSMPRSFTVYWPELFEQSDSQKAKTFLDRTNAWGVWKTTGLEQEWPQREFATQMDSLTDEEAEQLVEAAQANQEDMLAKQSLVEQANIDTELQKIQAGVVPDPQAEPPPGEGPPVANEGVLTDEELWDLTSIADRDEESREAGPGDLEAFEAEWEKLLR